MSNSAKAVTDPATKESNWPFCFLLQKADFSLHSGKVFVHSLKNIPLSC